MALLFWLAKPALYVLAFALARRLFDEHAPWLRVIGAALGRLVVGFGFGMALMMLGLFERPTLLFPLLFAAGFGLWLGCARLAFQEVALGRIASFALVAELFTIAVDVAAWKAASSIRFC